MQIQVDNCYVVIDGEEFRLISHKPASVTQIFRLNDFIVDRMPKVYKQVMEQHPELDKVKSLGLAHSRILDMWKELCPRVLDKMDVIVN